MPLDRARYGAAFGPIGARIADLIDKWYPKSSELYVTSAYRAHEEDGGTWSQHNGQTYQGSPTAAIDLGAWDFGVAEGSRRMRDVAKWLYDNFGDLTVEMFHTTPYNTDNGFNIRDQHPTTGIKDHDNHVHYATSAALLDQMEARAQEKWGTAPAPSPDSVLFGYDGSDFSQVRDFSGLSFVTHKITEAVQTGEIYVHQQFAAVVTAARDQGIPFLGAYVVPRTGGFTPSQEAEVAVVEAKRQTPWLLDHPGFFWQVDLERWKYDSVAPELGVQLLAALRAKTGKPGILYASQGQYGDTIPGTDNLWNANYSGSGSSRPFRQMYLPDGPGWRPYSRRTPVIWQYASDAIFADGNVGDANAFRGTGSDFRRIVLGQDGTSEENELDRVEKTRLHDANTVTWAMSQLLDTVSVYPGNNPDLQPVSVPNLLTAAIRSLQADVAALKAKPSATAAQIAAEIIKQLKP